MNIETKTIASGGEQDQRARFGELYRESPIPANEQLANVGLFVKRQELTKTLFMNELYQKFLNV
ncbi:MAG: crotonobetainyl-CoA--carnitine CoA-transferase, partial [Bacteroidia bacterium]